MSNTSAEETPTHTHHGIDYIEFTVRDIPAAKAFYSAAFGWTFTDYGPEYTGIHRMGGEAGESGGFFQTDDVKTNGPLVILYSSDLDATLASVEKAGGTIVNPIFEFPGGKRFHFTDPSGNELAVWSPT